MKIWEISMNIHEHMARWPSDDSFDLQTMSTHDTSTCHTSAIRMSLHAGTHMDAPLHFVKNGKTVNDIELSKYIGDCRVIECNKPTHVNASDLQPYDPVEGEILLIKTANSAVKPSEAFNPNFFALSEDAAQFLVERKVKTIGIDALSIEPYGKNGAVHRMILGADIGVLEGLQLADVSAGSYFLSALPLKIKKAEASPVRAVLIRR